jgi:hypothetical protein
MMASDVSVLSVDTATFKHWCCSSGCAVEAGCVVRVCIFHDWADNNNVVAVVVVPMALIGAIY